MPGIVPIVSAFGLSLLSVSASAQTFDEAAVERAVGDRLGRPAKVRLFDLNARQRSDGGGGTMQVVCGRAAEVDGLGGLTTAVPFVYLPDGSVRLGAGDALLDVDVTRSDAVSYSGLCLR